MSSINVNPANTIILPLLLRTLEVTVAKGGGYNDEAVVFGKPFGNEDSLHQPDPTVARGPGIPANLDLVGQNPTTVGGTL